MDRTILIVEDHVDSREMLADALGFSGYKVLQASDGPQGEELAASRQPDLILLDISLPTKSGLEVLRSLRSQESTRHIPVIALTAHARPEDEQQAVQAGCNAYLTKPVKPRHVIQVIARLLNEDAQ
ncbi:MAG: response regulator [bacterium]